MDDEQDNTRFHVFYGGLVAILILFLVILLSLLTAQMAHAQQPTGAMCGPFPQMRDTLATQFREVEIGVGQVSDTAMIMLFASPDGKTWTILQLNSAGIACVAAAGKDWDSGKMPRNDERGT